MCLCINTVKSGYPVKASVHAFVCVMSFMISWCETAQTRVWICVYRSVGIMSSGTKQKNGRRGSNRRQKLVGEKKKRENGVKGEVEMSTGEIEHFLVRKAEAGHESLLNLFWRKCNICLSSLSWNEENGARGHHVQTDVFHRQVCMQDMQTLQTFNWIVSTPCLVPFLKQ